ncbi:hypothetical protein HDU98_001208, partial [Podochytrium sp. JEL0797]
EQDAHFRLSANFELDGHTQECKDTLRTAYLELPTDSFLSWYTLQVIVGNGEEQDEGFLRDIQDSNSPPRHEREYTSVREMLEAPHSILNLARMNIDSMGLTPRLSDEVYAKVQSLGMKEDPRFQVVVGPLMDPKRYETEFPVFIKKIWDWSAGIKCDVCGVHAVNEESDHVKPLKRCQQCMSHYYCSVNCHRAAWKVDRIMCHVPTTSLSLI